MTIIDVVVAFPAVHALHVVTLVPAARESIAFLGSVTVPKHPNIRVVSVVMHSMGFSFMSE
jgi:hypothetical protein